MEFKNLKELMSYLSDKQRCREYYAWLRWGGNPVCPHCNATKPLIPSNVSLPCFVGG